MSIYVLTHGLLSFLRPCSFWQEEKSVEQVKYTVSTLTPTYYTLSSAWGALCPEWK